jgi:two-component system, LytTR family, response regulator
VPWVEAIHEAGDGLRAIEQANQARPELLFLDIVMPGATGLEVLEKLDYHPHVVFTTAFDRYAVSAFEIGALDYVVKPFTRERLLAVLKRAEETLKAQDGAGSILARARESLVSREGLSRIFVRDGGRILPIPLATLERIEGADDYATVYCAGKQYLVGVRLAELEQRLAAAHFLRVHRSHLVNLEHVSSIEPYDAARLEVVMRSGTRIIASRTGSRRLRELAL